MLRKVSSRPPNNIRKRSIQDQVAWADGRDMRVLGQSAINKNLGGVKLSLENGFRETSQFHDRDWRNPFEGFSKKPKGVGSPIKPFSNEQLLTIFSEDVFTPRSAEKFWIPLLLFYTRARLDEIAQLHTDDIKLEPMPHLVIENLDDDDPVLAKKVKTLSSQRSIPLHKCAVEIGFFEYWKTIKAVGHIHLFPNLNHEQGRRRGTSVSKSFITAFRNHGERHPETGLNSHSFVTHSLRRALEPLGFGS